MLISDAAESLGARYKGRRAGSVGQAAVFSFNGNKIITTSGGGMVVTASPTLVQAGVRFLATGSSSQSPHYEHTEIGFNYRLSNLLAAVGRGPASGHWPTCPKWRAANARYHELLAASPGDRCSIPDARRESRSSGSPAHDRRRVFGEAGAHPVGAGNDRHRGRDPSWKPMHLQPVFKGTSSYLNGVSDDLFNRGLCLPSGSSLSSDDQMRVTQVVKAVSALVGQRPCKRRM